MSQKKIALLLFNYFPFGGLQKDFYSIARELKKRNFQIKIFTGKWTGENPEGFEIQQVGISGITNHKRNINFTQKVKKELESYLPDLVFGFNKMPGLDFYFAADTCFKYKAVKTKSRFYRLTNRYKNSVKYEEAVFGRKATTKILLLNNKQQDEFTNQYQTDLDRLDLIPPGIPNLWSNAKPYGIRSKLNLGNDARLVLFVGSDFKRKGLDRAIEALASYNKEYPDAYLLIAGQDDLKPYKKLIQRKETKNKVIFLGPVKNISGLMQEADLLIHPAREEAAGNVIVEAMVSSLPVLTCDAVGFASLVEEYNSGFVLKGNFKQEEFNKLLINILSTNLNIQIRERMHDLKENKFFYSRFRYIADKIEEYFSE